MQVVAWAEEYVRSLTPHSQATPPSQGSLTLSPVVPVQPVKQPTVPRRKITMPAIAEPTAWEQQFIEKNKLELYDLLLVYR